MTRKYQDEHIHSSYDSYDNSRNTFDSKRIKKLSPLESRRDVSDRWSRSSNRRYGKSKMNHSSKTEYEYSHGDTAKIPKIIMQTWKNRQIPVKWRSSARSIKKYMSDWKHVLMTDDDNREFIKEHFPDFLSHYDKFPYNIQRADAIRACWLYIHGGIYMDLDIEILRPLDSLFNEPFGIYLVNSGNFSSYATNSFMACQPRHHIWLEYIEQMKKPLNKWVMGKHFTVMTTTGPIALTNVLRNTSHKYAVLPTKLLMPCSVCEPNCKIRPDAYLKPLKGGSWNGWDSHFLNFFLCNWKTVIIVVIILIILIILLLVAFSKKSSTLPMG